MKIRFHTLWKVPLYCAVASWISFYVTVYLGGFFFIVETAGENGITELSADPLRSALFEAILFLFILLLGGLWAFRSMTKREIAVSSAITSAIYLLIVLAQILVPDFPLRLNIALAYFQTWKSILSSLLYSLIPHSQLSAILSSFAPLLFIPLGKKAPK